MRAPRTAVSRAAAASAARRRSSAASSAASAANALVDHVHEIAGRVAGAAHHHAGAAPEPQADAEMGVEPFQLVPDGHVPTTTVHRPGLPSPLWMYWPSRMTLPTSTNGGASGVMALRRAARREPASHDGRNGIERREPRIRGRDVKAFLDTRRANRKQPLAAGQIYCVACHAPNEAGELSRISAARKSPEKVNAAKKADSQIPVGHAGEKH